MVKEVRFTVYGDPVPKARPRVYGNHGVTPQKTKIQEQKIALVYKSQYHDAKFEKDVPLKIVVDMFMRIPKSTSEKNRKLMIAGKIRPIKKRCDSDNGTKLVMDSLNGVAYYDDSQVVDERGRKFYSDTPRTEIYIAEINTDEE